MKSICDKSISNTIGALKAVLGVLALILANGNIYLTLSFNNDSTLNYVITTKGDWYKDLLLNLNKSFFVAKLYDI